MLKNYHWNLDKISLSSPSSRNNAQSSAVAKPSKIFFISDPAMAMNGRQESRTLTICRIEAYCSSDSLDICCNHTLSSNGDLVCLICFLNLLQTLKRLILHVLVNYTKTSIYLYTTESFWDKDMYNQVWYHGTCTNILIWSVILQEQVQLMVQWEDPGTCRVSLSCNAVVHCASNLKSAIDMVDNVCNQIIKLFRIP